MLYISASVLLATLALAAPQSRLDKRQVGDSLRHVKRAEPEEVARLFARQNTNYPPVNEIVDRANIPQAWLDKLATVSLPNIPVSTDPGNTGRPQYAGFDSASKQVCSFTYECVDAADLYAPPAGRYAVTFDDGPSGGSESLENYMRSQGIMGVATHFMIGSYITYNQDRFQSIANGGGHICSHTWSHHYMTTLTNEQIVGELGWSLQIMANLNQGRISRYWRPPYGDVDNRVRAIAKGVFGLETVVWNHDTGDWNLDQGNSYTVDSVVSTFNTWFQDKSQGINVLEHEVRPSQIEVFKQTYPAAKQAGWQVGNVADMFNLPWYQNAQGPNSTVTSMAVGGAAPSGLASGSISASASVSPSGSVSGSVSASATSASASGASQSLSARSMSSAASTGPTGSAAASASSAAARPSSAASMNAGLGMTGSGLIAGMMGLMGALLM